MSQDDLTPDDDNRIVDYITVGDLSTKNAGELQINILNNGSPVLIPAPEPEPEPAAPTNVLKYGSSTDNIFTYSLSTRKFAYQSWNNSSSNFGITLFSQDTVAHKDSFQAKFPNSEKSNVTHNGGFTSGDYIYTRGSDGDAFDSTVAAAQLKIDASIGVSAWNNVNRTSLGVGGAIFTFPANINLSQDDLTPDDDNRIVDYITVGDLSTKNAGELQINIIA